MTMRRLPDGPGRFPYSVAYFRLNWEEIEPAEGQYNWRLIDEALAAWAKREARIAFRIMTTNAHSRSYYCSPKWLFDAGCKSYDYVEGGADAMAGGTRINRIEPDYSDPVYLEKHGRFIKALAERYDGNPQIEFLDIGSYGIWGEWQVVNHYRYYGENEVEDEMNASLALTATAATTTAPDRGRGGGGGHVINIVELKVIDGKLMYTDPNDAVYIDLGNQRELEK